MIHHMGVTPQYILRYTDLKKRREVINWPGTDGELTDRLKEDAADGIIYPIGKCNRWNDHKGCPGHKKESEI